MRQKRTKDFNAFSKEQYKEDKTEKGGPVRKCSELRRFTLIIKSNQQGEGICGLGVTSMLNNWTCWNNSSSLQKQEGKLLKKGTNEGKSQEDGLKQFDNVTVTKKTSLF